MERREQTELLRRIWAELVALDQRFAPGTGDANDRFDTMRVEDALLRHESEIARPARAPRPHRDSARGKS